MSISSPAEVFKLQRVVSKADWSSIGCSPIFHFKFQVMQIWKVIAANWLVALGTLHILTALAFTGPRVARQADRASDITLASLAPEIAVRLQVVESIFALATRSAAYVGFAETLASHLPTLSNSIYCP